MKTLKEYINESIYGPGYTTTTTANMKVNFQPRNRKELIETVKALVKERGDNADLNDIDTSHITDMSNLFYGMYNFNGDISQWDVSKVECMDYMFGGARSFNGDLSKWDVSKVYTMIGMFYDATHYEGGGISDWNVSKVECMDEMFCYDKFFNCDISKWNVSRVKSHENMFLDCKLPENRQPKFKD